MNRVFKNIFRLMAWGGLCGLTLGRAWAVLPAPGGFSASTSDGAVSLQWNPVPSATAYFLYRGLNQDSPTGTLTPTETPTDTPTGTQTPAAPLAAIAAGTQNYNDYQVTNGRNYLYQVGALDNTGLGLLAQATAIPFSVPDAVQPVTVSNIHSGALDLSWGTPLSSFPVSYYQVYRYAVLTPSPTGTATPAKTLPVDPIPAATVIASVTPIATVLGTAFTDDTAGALLTNGIYYLVIAVDNQVPPGLGMASVSSTKPALPKNMAPAAPFLAGLVSASATPQIGIDGYGTRLFWNGPGVSEGVTAYQIFSGNVPIATVAVATPSPTYSFDDTTIPFSSNLSGITSYKVVAMNTDGSTSSNLLQQNILKSSVSSPIQVTPNATVDATQGVTVAWNQGSAGSYGLSGYRIYKSRFGVPLAATGGQPGSPTPTGSATPTVTPTPFATLVITPLASPTLVVIDGGVTNAHGWSYWVEPFDQLFLGGTNGIPTPSVLNLAPTPVGTVTAVPTPGTNNQIEVSWSEGGAGFYGPPKNYAIYREFTSALTLTPVATVPAPQTSFIDHAVGTPGTPVVYQVAAVDSQGNSSAFSGFSNTVNLSSQVMPGKPETLPASSSPASLTLGWSANPASDNVDGYAVFGPDFPTLTTTPTPLAAVIPTPGASSYGYSVPATDWNVSVDYVAAHNSSGWGQASAIAAIALPTYQVTAVMTPDGPRNIYISWNVTPTPGSSTPGIDSYGIYRSQNSGTGFTPVATLAASAPDYVDSNISAGKNYYYRITARSSGGGVTAESPVYPTMAPTPEGKSSTWPNAPAGVTVVGGMSQTNLSWQGNAAQENITGYSVYKNGTFTSTVTPALTNQVIFAEAPGSVSSYQVGAENAQGAGDLSQPPVSILAPPAVTPTIGTTPPPAYTPTPGVTPLHLVWISGLDYTGAVDGYTIYRSTVSGTTGFSAVGSIPAPVSIFSDSSFGADNVGVTNFYKAAATGMGLQTDPALSGALPVEIWPNIPAISFTSSDTAVTLDWATPQGNVSVTSYTVYKNIYPSLTPTAIATVLPPSTSYPDPDVTPGIPYYYWLDAKNSGGSSDFPGPQSVIPLKPPTLSLTPLAGRNSLTWSQVTVVPSNIVTGYAVFRAIPTPGATPSFVPVSGVLRGLATTTYTDTTVLDSVSYVYEVAAASLNGQYSAYSNAVSVTVQPQPVLTLTAVSSDGLVQLRWIYQGAPTNSYIVQRKLGTDSDDAYQTIKSGVIGVNYQDNGVLDKTFYDYRVITVDSFGLTAISPPAIGLPAAPPIVANGAVSVSQGQGGNTLSWFPADTSASGAVSLYDLYKPTSMYPLGGYSLYRSVDGGAVYQPLVAIVPAAAPGTAPGPNTYSDGVSLVEAPSYTYLVQAFDAPPDIPGVNSQSQAVTEGLVHITSYNTVIAYSLSASTALDRNAIRPFGAANAQKVDIRFVVTQPGRVNIKVYSLNGTFVRELVNQDFATGVYGMPDSTFPLSWDARNMNGNLVASGVYLISTEMAGGHQEFQKVAVIK